MMLEYLITSTNKRSRQVLCNIQHTVLGGDGSVFIDLATNKFGSFVLDRVIESCTSERCMLFTQLLKQSGHFGQLQKHAHAKHCIRCLCECLQRVDGVCFVDPHDLTTLVGAVAL